MTTRPALAPAPWDQRLALLQHANAWQLDGRAAVAVGIDALFVEVHDAPERALSDGPNALRLDLLPELWRRLRALDELVKSGFLHI